MVDSVEVDSVEDDHLGRQAVKVEEEPDLVAVAPAAMDRVDRARVDLRVVVALAEAALRVAVVLAVLQAEVVVYEEVAVASAESIMVRP